MNYKAWNKKDGYMCKSKRSLATIITNQMTGNIMGGGFHCYNRSNEEDDYIILQGTGITDKNGNEIFADDILIGYDYKMRVYHIAGGFALKSHYWAEDIGDLTVTDQLVMNAMSDAQTRSYITQSCEIIGNYHELLKSEQ